MARSHVVLTLALVLVLASIATSRSRARDAVPGRPASPDSRAEDPYGHPAGDDDDDDDDATPALRVGFADVESSPPTIVLLGTGLCQSPRVRAGRRDGSPSDLVVFNAGSNFVQAGLVETDPGTYRFEVACPGATTSIDVTLGAVGPQGPPGRPGQDGILAGQSCPEGTVAIGFDLAGTLQCTARPPLSGACPCLADDERLRLLSIIADGIAAEPDASELTCLVVDDFIVVDFLLSPASGGTETQIHMFGRDDTCGLLTRIPGDGVVEMTLRPLAPGEAAACNAAIFDSGVELNCF